MSTVRKWPTGSVGSFRMFGLIPARNMGKLAVLFRKRFAVLIRFLPGEQSDKDGRSY